MVFQSVNLEAGLYLVATPIGTARDITLRALDILASADVLAAEDTRTLRRLMDLHGVPLGERPLVSYHDHSPAKARARLMEEVRAGRSVAYASEAGTPLVADPGYRLAAEMRSEGLEVRAAPGPSALLAALSVAGLPTDRFCFLGFPPSQSSARRQLFQSLKNERSTLVFFEAPGRVHGTLDELCYALGEEREAAVCRELTKRFEEVRRGRLADLAREAKARPPKGEVVLVVDRGTPPEASEGDIDAALRAALSRGTVRDAAAEVAEIYGISRRQAYQRALELERDV